MKRATGFLAPSLFEDIIGSNENNVVTKILNKKKLPRLERPKLEELNEVFLRKLPLTSSPSVKEHQT